MNTYTGTVDLAVIAVPAASVLKAVESSIRAEAKAIAVITAGFRETGPEGSEMQSKIAQLCSQAGVRLLGPNCLGLINTGHRMNASFSKRMPKAGDISVLSQSGAVCTRSLEAGFSGLGSHMDFTHGAARASGGKSIVALESTQNHGIGTFLLKYLVTIARRNGIAGFTAEVLVDNRPMMAVLHKSGCKIRSQLEDRVYSFELDFE